MIHAGGVLFVQRRSLWFPSKNSLQSTTETSYLSLIEKKERDQILKESFAGPFSESEEGVVSIKPHAEILSKPFLHTPMAITERESSDLQISFQQNLPFPTEDLLSFHTRPKFAFPSQEPLNLFNHLSKDLILPQPDHPVLPTLAPAPLPPFQARLTSSPIEIKKEETPTPQIVYAEALLNSSPLREGAELPKKSPLATLPSQLPHLPSLAELETSSFSDMFDADLVFLPREEGEGYIFALTLIPRQDLNLPKLPQHFTFLIDRSNSIQSDRLVAVKNAVHKALEELFPDDSFNIIAFDSKMEKLSPHALPFSLESLAKAEAFLEKISLGSFFSQANLYKPLFLTVPGQSRDNDVHTAILLTDSESLGKKNEQKALLSDWTLYNKGKVSLFAIGLKGDHHLGTLDAATAFNRGNLSHSPTKRGIKRKLLKLMKTIQNPIAKNLSINAISRSPQTKIEIFPKPSQSPHLYLDQPYVIIGTTRSLDSLFRSPFL